MDYIDKLDYIADILQRIKDKDGAKWLLMDMLTPQEVETIYERVLIIENLISGMSQRDIAEKLNVSITTVNRGSRTLKYGTGEAKKTFNSKG